MLPRLRSLLDNLRRHPHSTCSYLAQTGSKHMRACAPILSISHPTGQILLHALIRDEEQRCARRGANYRTANAIVDATKAARGPKAGTGLETGFESVEWKEGGVYCCAC